MPRGLILWRRNPVAPWPTDPAEFLKLLERSWAGIDGLIKKGVIKEFGYFLDGKSGYIIGEAESTEIFRDVSMFLPFQESEVHEIIAYEKGKEIWREIAKAWIEAAKK